MSPMWIVVVLIAVELFLAAVGGLIYLYNRYHRQRQKSIVALTEKLSEVANRLDAVLPSAKKLAEIGQLEVDRLNLLGQALAGMKENVTRLTDASSALASIVAAPAPKPAAVAEVPGMGKPRVDDFLSIPTDADKNRQFRINEFMSQGHSRGEAETMADAERDLMDVFPAAPINAEA